MKFKLVFCLLLATNLINKSTCLAQSATYNLDLAKSKLYWKGTKKVGTAHLGFIWFKSGKLTTDDSGKPVGGDFVIDMTTMRSTDHPIAKDNKEVNDRLFGDEFFSVKAYPTSAIKIINISLTGSVDQYKVTGDLTIKNATHRITFTAMVKPAGKRLIATADFSIDRIKWGIHERPDPGVMWSLQNVMMTDEIPIRLYLELVKN